MPAPSPIQLLPLHVIKLIVSHVVDSIRLCYDGVKKDSKEYKALLKQLLQVSRNFRAIALPLYCNYFKLNIPIISQDARGVYDLLTSSRGDARITYRYLGHPTHHLAKELEIELDEWTIYSGRAVEVLSCAPYDIRSFPLVRKLELVFVDYDKGGDIRVNPLRAEANISAFVERIRQMAPLVGEIRVEPVIQGSEEDLPRPDSYYFGKLVSRLYQLVGRIEYGDAVFSVISLESCLDKLCNIVHIKHKSEDSFKNTNEFLQLARRNALILQSFIIQTEDEDIDVSSLFRCTDGRFVTYPCLHKLELHGPPIVNISQRQVFPGAVPFPSLRRLHIRRVYQLDDDTLFRGNAATLESLAIELSTSSASMLRRYSVFTPASHPKLQYVDTFFHGDLVPDAFASKAGAVQFALNITPGAPVRSIYGAGCLGEPLAAILLQGNHLCIQVLSLAFTRLDFLDVVTLVKSLPLLSDLNSNPPTLGQPPSAVTLDMFPADLAQSYASWMPVNERFRCWKFFYFIHDHFADTAICVLLLALVCPNFDYATPHFSERKKFMQQMEAFIISNTLKPYELRLRRLLFNGWNDC
ncbi:hypothetical protein GGH94_001898 [Coemansia aciculifera]|uniref:Uncharacterized protein n=1 Tax=Coemansia aciculifera TaxID=417176 RepID=A0A9W8ITC5_9FUNG|nr:hypothetical protein GGH94_001898 [Coemansia aciculifera]